MSSHIPFDICVQISERLPIKSLIRCRSLCKAWKSFIDCSEFIAGYSFRYTQSQHLMIRSTVGYGKEKEVNYVSFVDDDTFPQQKFAPTVPLLVQILDANGSRIIGSSHGLLCFYGYYHREQEEEMVVFWNPSIKKSIAVVVPNVLNAAFSSVLGFGVCPDTSDPKLVQITYISVWWKVESTSYIPCQVMVFSLNSKEWTYPRNNLPRKSIEFTWSQAVIGKFIYWFACDRIAEDGGFRDHNLIMSFDMSTDKFQEIKLPDSLAHAHHPFTSFSISRLRDSLALLEYTEDITWKQVCVVWMMEHGDPKSFTKLYTIKPPHAAASIHRTLGFRKSGKPIIDIALDYFYQTLVVYEPLSEHIKDLEISVNRCKSFVNFYTESLLLLNEEDDCIYSL